MDDLLESGGGDSPQTGDDQLNVFVLGMRLVNAFSSSFLSTSRLGTFGLDLLRWWYRLGLKNMKRH
jgi:hypothetical protein